jgi:hypothetical protein
MTDRTGSNIKKSRYLVGSYAGFMASTNFENDSSMGTDSLMNNLRGGQINGSNFNLKTSFGDGLEVPHLHANIDYIPDQQIGEDDPICMQIDSSTDAKINIFEYQETDQEEFYEI